MNPFLHSTVASPQTVPGNISSRAKLNPASAAKHGRTLASGSTPASELISEPEPGPQAEKSAQLPAAKHKIHQPSSLLGGFLGAALLSCILALYPPTLQAALDGQSGLGINVNIATVTQLLTIKGIGPKTAALIVSERERAGPYVSFQDFVERIKGIGPKRAAALREAGVRVSSSPPPVR